MPVAHSSHIFLYRHGLIQSQFGLIWQQHKTNKGKMEDNGVATTHAANNGSSTKGLTKDEFIEILQSSIFDSSVYRAMKPILKEITSEIKHLDATVKSQHRRISQLEGTVKQQSAEIDELKKQHQSQDRQERLKNLRITGLKCHPDNAHSVIKELLTENLGVHLQENDFQTRVLPNRRGNQSKKWIGPQSRSSPSRSVEEVKATDTDSQAECKQEVRAIVHFSNIWKRREVFSSKRYLKNTQVFINEDLPKFENDLLYECRKLKKDKVIKACYSKDLSVYIRSHSGSEIQIKSDADLDPFRVKEPERSSTPLGPVNIGTESRAVNNTVNSLDDDETFYGFSEQEISLFS